MEVRKLIDPRDWLESERVIATAFLHPWDEDEARKQVDAQANGEAPRYEESWGLFDDGVMLTSISTLRHQLSLGGETIAAGEVHMVGSLPGTFCGTVTSPVPTCAFRFSTNPICPSWASSTRPR